MYFSNFNLQSHNISANQIRQDANARRAAALASQQAAATTADGQENEPPEPDSDPEPVPSRRKRESKETIDKRKKEEEVRWIPSATWRLILGWPIIQCLANPPNRKRLPKSKTQSNSSAADFNMVQMRKCRTRTRLLGPFSKKAWRPFQIRWAIVRSAIHDFGLLHIVGKATRVVYSARNAPRNLTSRKVLLERKGRQRLVGNEDKSKATYSMVYTLEPRI